MKTSNIEGKLQVDVDDYTGQTSLLQLFFIDKMWSFLLCILLVFVKINTTPALLNLIDHSNVFHNAASHEKNVSTL